MYSPDKRRQELIDIINEISHDFIAEHPNCEFEKNYNLDKIMFNYEILLEKGIKPAFVDGVDLCIYKVASGLELVVLHSQPIRSTNPFDANTANVQFAIEIAKQYLFSKLINGVQDVAILEGFDGLSEQENGLILKHENYLLISSTANSILDYSVLPNALFWEALCCSIMKNFKKG